MGQTNREYTPSGAQNPVPTHDSRQKKGPAKRVPRSAGFATCSPRGIREPHDIAPRGSWHLSGSNMQAGTAHRKVTWRGSTGRSRALG